jgi:hypothetical protein
MGDQSRTERWRSIANLSAQVPVAYELLRRIGIERRRSRAARAAERAGWFGAGAALGTGLALLFAPRNGQELRKRLATRAKRAREAVSRETSGAGNSGERHASAEPFRG